LRMPHLSVIVPTYNEAENIEPLVRALGSALKDADYEILIVDDDSPDLTWARAEEMAKSDSRVRVIRRTREKGLAPAVIEGFGHARGEILACMDGDLQHDPATLVPMLQQMQRGCVLVVASRYVESGSTGTWNPIRKIESLMATKLAQWCVGAKLRDPMSGFFMMRQQDFVAIRDRLRAQGFKILLEIVANLGSGSIVEVPLHFRSRLSGQSKLSRAVALSYIAQLVRLSRANRISRPAKLGVARPE
jgi:dolichol-phosphate mannosyltransferase